MSVSTNSAIAGSGGGTWGSISGTLSSQSDLQSALDAKLSANSPLVVTSGFTFAKATHANRRIEYNSASPGNATFDGTAAFTTDDSFRLVQVGAGAVTLVASGVTFVNPKSLSLTTTGVGTWIDAEWDATLSQLIVTGVSMAPAVASGVQVLSMTAPQAVAAAATNVKSTTFSVPAGTLGKKGAIRITFTAAKTGGAEACAWSVRFGATGFTYSGGTIANNGNPGTGTGTFVCEAWIYANGSDTTTLLATPPGGAAAFTTNNAVTQNSLTLNHGTTDFEIAIGGNGGTTAGTGATWIVTNAQCLVMPMAA